MFLLATAVLMGYLLGSTRHLNIGIIVDPEVHLEAVSRIVEKMSSTYQGHPEGILNQEPNLNITWVVLNSAGLGHTIRTVCGMVNKSIQGLVTGLRCSQSRTVSTVTERFQIPHLSVDLYPCPPVVSEEFTLHLSTPYKTLARVLVDVVKALGWRHVGLGFNHKLGFTIKQEILVQLSLAGIQSVLLNNWRTSNMTEPSTNAKIFFLMENVDVHERTDGTTLHWALSTSVVVVQDMLLPTTNTAKGVTNVVLVNPTLSVVMLHAFTKGMAKSDTTIKTNCSKETQQPSTQGGKIMRELHRSCGYGKSGYGENLNLSIDYDLYVIPAGSDGRVISIGEWTESRGLTIHETAPYVTNRLFTNKPNDFRGVTLRIGVHGESVPFSNRGYPGSKKFYGMTIDMLEDIASALNFRYTIDEPADNLYGARLDNGSWSGVIGMLQRGEIDIGVGIFSVNTERSEVLDFTTAFSYEGLGILAPKPVESPDLFQAFKSFGPDIWLSLLAVAISACVGFAFIASKSTSRKDKKRGIQENMLLVISSYFEQGPTFHPSSVSARCFLTFWFIFTVLTMTMYTAHLAAVLTVSSPVKPIDTLEDLAERTDLQIYVREGTSTSSMFSNSKKPLLQRIASRIVLKKDINKYFSIIGDGKFCIIGERSYMEYHAVQSCGKARFGSEDFRRYPLAFIVAKHSPFKKAIDNIIQKMVESGVIDSLSQKWIRAPARCPPTNSSGGVDRLGLNALGGIFIVYGAVTSVAACVLLVKLCTHRCTRHVAD